MRKEFTVFKADDALRTVVETFVPGDVAMMMPVVDAAGALVGIVEPHDLLRTDSAEQPLKMRELARQDYVLAQPGELVDQVQRDMMRKETENVAVVAAGDSKPVGIARANDILQLRRWLMEEETREPRKQPVAGSQ